METCTSLPTLSKEAGPSQSTSSGYRCVGMCGGEAALPKKPVLLASTQIGKTRWSLPLQHRNSAGLGSTCPWRALRSHSLKTKSSLVGSPWSSATMTQHASGTIPATSQPTGNFPQELPAVCICSSPWWIHKLQPPVWKNIYVMFSLDQTKCGPRPGTNTCNYACIVCMSTMICDGVFVTFWAIPTWLGSPISHLIEMHLPHSATSRQKSHRQGDGWILLLPKPCGIFKPSRTNQIEDWIK